MLDGRKDSLAKCWAVDPSEPEQRVPAIPPHFSCSKLASRLRSVKDPADTVPPPPVGSHRRSPPSPSVVSRLTIVLQTTRMWKMAIWPTPWNFTGGGGGGGGSDLLPLYTRTWPSVDSYRGLQLALAWSQGVRGCWWCVQDGSRIPTASNSDPVSEVAGPGDAAHADGDEDNEALVLLRSTQLLHIIDTLQHLRY